MMDVELNERDFRDADQELQQAAGDANFRFYAACRRTFGTPTGQYVLAYLRRYVRHQRTPFVPGQPDGTAFFCGQHDVLNLIVNALTMDYEEVRQLRTAGSGLPQPHGVDPMWAGPVMDDFLSQGDPHDGNAQS